MITAKEAQKLHGRIASFEQAVKGVERINTARHPEEVRKHLEVQRNALNKFIASVTMPKHDSAEHWRTRYQHEHHERLRLQEELKAARKDVP